MKLRITEIDYAPEELYSQLPLEVTLVREIPGTDRPDYWLAHLDKPIFWIRNGTETLIAHLILCARYQREGIRPGVGSVTIGIAYVLEETVFSEAILDFKKCHYAAIGIAKEVA